MNNGLSILTLIYNNFEELEKTIRSVFSQDVLQTNAMQYIIADDGSNYFDKKWIENIIADCSNGSRNVPDVVIYTNTENIGTVRSFNKAVEKASGDIIVTLSCGDQFFSSSSVSEIVQAFQISGAPIITGFREIVEGDRIIERAPRKDLVPLFRKGNENKLLKTLAIKGNFISGACTYYSKDFLLELGGFDENFRLLEDYPIYLKTLNKGFNIHFIEKTIMKHATGGVSDQRKTVNNTLNQDFMSAKNWIENNVSMNFLEWRLYKYFQHFSKKERLSLVNILYYPDCFIYWLYSTMLFKLSR